MRLLVISVLVVLGFAFFILYQSSQANSRSSNIDKIKEYLELLHKEEIIDISTNIDKNEGNLGAGEYTYTARYNTKKLAYRTAYIKYYNREKITPESDSYSQEIASLYTDGELEKDQEEIKFIAYIRIMGSRADRLDLSVENYEISDLQEKLFLEAEFQIRIIVSANDILENREKYEDFYIEIMKRLKENHIEKGSLEFIFVNEQLDLEANRISPEFVILFDSELKKNTIQKWSAIHNNKWYELVKDHPRKVLKYTKIFDN